MTTRQLVVCLKAIDIRTTKKTYYHNQFMARLFDREMETSLESVLGVTSEESQFDDKSQRALDEHAEKMLKEQKMLRKLLDGR